MKNMSKMRIMKRFVSLNAFTNGKSVDNLRILENEATLMVTPKFQISTEFLSVIFFLFNLK